MLYDQENTADYTWTNCELCDTLPIMRYACAVCPKSGGRPMDQGGHQIHHTAREIYIITIIITFWRAAGRWTLYGGRKAIGK